MTDIFLVTGTTGEHEDEHAWIVCAYKCMQAAQDHVDKANAEAKEIFDARGTKKIGLQPSSWDFVCRTYATRSDPHMSMDYTGTEYHVEIVKLNE